MKKLIRMLLSACACALLFVLLTACTSPAPVWSLDATVEQTTVAPGSEFVLTVTTKNTGGDFMCDYHTKVVGAMPSLYLDIGAGRVYLAFEPIGETTTEARSVTFAGGEEVMIEWTFRANTRDDIGNLGEMAAPAGKYTLKLTFQGKEKIIENFLEIKVAE